MAQIVSCKEEHMSKKREIKRILVSQPKPQHPKSPYFLLEEKYGVQIDFKPFFTIEPVSQRDFRDQKINILDHSAVVLTSRIMMGHFFDLVKELRIDVPDEMKYFLSSEPLSTYMQKFITVKKRKVYYPDKTVSSGSTLEELLEKYPKESFLIPTIEGTSNETALAELEKKKIAHTLAVMSKVAYTPITEKEIEQYDLILFFSPNGIDSLYHSLPKYVQGEQLLGSMGEKTLEAMQAHGLRADLVAPTEQFPSITVALEHLLKE